MKNKRQKILLCGPGISGDRELISSLQSHYTLTLTSDIEHLERNIKINDVALILFELSNSRKAELRTIKKIKSKNEELVIIVINNQKSIHYVVEVFNAGAIDVFSAPYKTELVAERVEAILKTTDPNEYVY